MCSVVAQMQQTAVPVEVRLCPLRPSQVGLWHCRQQLEVLLGRPLRAEAQRCHPLAVVAAVVVVEVSLYDLQCQRWV